MKTDTGGYIYAIGGAGLPWIKIGRARDVTQRLRQLQIGYPVSLRIIGVVNVEEKARAVEAAVHRFLADKEHRGEWFDVAITDSAQLAALVTEALAWLANEQKRQARTPLHVDSVVSSDQQETLLGLRLVTCLHQQGLTVYKLAKLAHLPLTPVQRLCKGQGKQPSVWTLVALADALHVSLDYLVGRTDTP